MAENEPAEAVDWEAEAVGERRDALILRALKEKIENDQLNVSLKKPKSDDFPRYMERRKKRGKIDKSFDEKCWCQIKCAGTWGGTGNVGKKLGNKDWKPCLAVLKHREDTYESWCRRLDQNRKLLIEIMGQEKFDARLKDAKDIYELDIKQLNARLRKQGLRGASETSQDPQNT